MRGRPKGSPKTPGSGRKKGTRNKNSLPLLEMAEKLQINPFEVLLLFAAGDWKRLGYESKIMTTDTQYGVKENYTIDPAVRARAAAEAAHYLYPKLKATEIKITNEDDDGAEELSDEELEAYTFGKG